MECGFFFRSSCWKGILFVVPILHEEASVLTVFICTQRGCAVHALQTLLERGTGLKSLDVGNRFCFVKYHMQYILKVSFTRARTGHACARKHTHARNQGACMMTRNE